MSGATDPPRDPAASIDSGPREPSASVAVSPHHLASAAGASVMAQGGSAVDAAIAVNAVLGVVLPDTCGIGGDLFALVHVPGDARPHALNASGRAGSNAAAADLRAAGHDEVPLRSPWSVTVPGCVDGWEALHGRFGRLAWSDVLAPAIDLARNGFPVSLELSNSLHRIHPLIGAQPSAPPLYPDGTAPAPGTVLRRAHLADTLEAISGAGREAFYDGPAGDGIIDATDGLITAADLERRQADWVDPISAEIFGMTGWTIPPNSQGYLTLAAASIFEHLDPPRRLSVDSVHAAVEAYRSVAWERDDLVGDPSTAPLPAEALLDPQRLASRAATISLDTAGVWPLPNAAPGGTAYMCTRDAQGMGVSFIQSNFHGIGSGLSAGATGVFLHNRGAGFCLREGHANELRAGRRPLHTLSPSLWTDGDRLRALLGTRGGQYQPQLLLQVAAHLWWHGMDPAAAVAAPRWVADGWGPGDTSRLHLEERMPEPIRAGLESKGHAVHLAGPWEVGWGPVSLITNDDEGTRGVADPRVSSAAVSVTG